MLFFIVNVFLTIPFLSTLSRSTSAVITTTLNKQSNFNEITTLIEKAFVRYLENKAYTRDMNTSNSGTFKIGGELEINRLGFGAMRITGEGVWGQPKDVEEAKRVLKRALELGVNFIDTADAYGPYVSEQLIGDTLAPYPAGVVIATKCGLIRPSAGVWDMDGRPEHIREAIEGSLKRLKLDCIDLYQLHRIDPKVPVTETIGALKELQQQGKIKHIGLSEVSVEEIKKVQEMVTVATVQNLYNIADRKHEDVLKYCEEQGIGFIPWFPLATGDLAKEGTPLAAIATKYNAMPSQIALAWLLKKSPVMLPIPGTSSVKHLEENMAGAAIDLSSEDFDTLNTLEFSK
jgi:pyridoxine 4-dehydrogenase